MNNSKSIAALMVVIAVALCASAREASAQPYVTAAAGISQHNIECSSLQECDNTGVAFKVLGGFRLGSPLAVEGVYFDFGEPLKVSNVSEDAYRTTALGAGVALHGSVSSLTLTARAGVARAAVDRSITFAALRTDALKFSELTPYGGVALGYRFTRYVALAVALDGMRSKWELDNLTGTTWISTAATVGLTIGR